MSAAAPRAMATTGAARRTCLLTALLAMCAVLPLGVARAEVPSFVANAEWVEVRTADYTIITNAGPGVRNDVVRLMRRFSRVIQQTHPDLRTRTAEPTLIYLFRDDSELARYTPPDIEHVSAYFLPSQHGNILVLSGHTEGEKRSEAVFHEATHLILHANIRDVPNWVDEGLAQYYQTCRFSGDGVEVGVPDADLFRWLSEHELMSMDLMFAINPAAPAYRQDNGLRILFYAQSAAMVHMLQSTPERASGFDRYLADLRSGTRQRIAFRKPFPEPTWPGLLTELRPYARDARTLKTHTISLPAEASVAAPVERTLDRAEALTALGELRLAMTEPGQATAAEHFRAALSANPAAGRAQANLGLIEDINGHAQAAEQWYGRALSGEVKDARLPVCAGRGTLERLRLAANAHAADEVLEPMAKSALNHFRAALAIDPDDVGAVVGYAASSVMLSLPSDTSMMRRLEQIAATTPGRDDVAFVVQLVHDHAAANSVPATSGAAETGQTGFGSGNPVPSLATLLVADTIRSIDDLMAAGRLDEARATLVRMQDRIPQGDPFHTEIVKALAGVDARRRLQKAAKLAGSQKYLEADRVLAEPSSWPDAEVQSIAMEMRLRIAIERSNQALHANRLPDARSILTKALSLPMGESEKADLRRRIKQIDQAQGKP